MFDGARHRRVIAIASLAALFVVGACSGDDDDAAGNTSTTSAESTTSTSTSSTTTEPPDPATEAEEVWAEAWSTAGQVETTAEDLAQIANPASAQRLVATLHLGEGEEGVTFEGRTVTNHPTVEENSDGTFTVNDCLLISPSVTSAEANWYSGTIAEVDGQLKVTGVEPEVVTGCVPASVADEVYAVNESFWGLLAQGVTTEDQQFLAMTTGEYGDYIPSFLAEHSGSEFRAAPAERHPEIIEYRSDFVSISDCQSASPDTGFFDVESGERAPGHDLEVEGSKNAVEVQLTLVDDEWKVASFGYLTGSNCEFAPTSLAIAEVG